MCVDIAREDGLVREQLCLFIWFCFCSASLSLSLLSLSLSLSLLALSLSLSLCLSLCLSLFSLSRSLFLPRLYVVSHSHVWGVHVKNHNSEPEHLYAVIDNTIVSSNLGGDRCGRSCCREAPSMYQCHRGGDPSLSRNPLKA